MNKIYKSSPQNRNSIAAIITKKIILPVLGMLLICSTAKAQVTVLPATPYTTLKAAFDAINAGTHTGAITININGNTTETATAVLNSSGTGAANYTSVLLKPTGTSSITGNIASNAIIKLFGADNVTIDGAISGVTRNLTISNSASSTGGTVIWLGSGSATDGATNNVIKNCNVNGSGSTTMHSVIVSSSGSTIGGLAEAPNSNNTYQNNAITSGLMGIILVGGGTTSDAGNIITSNSIGSATAANKMGHDAVWVAQQQNVTISKNVIFGVFSTAGGFTFFTSGIFVGGIISGGLVEKNNVSDVEIAGFWGCNGIMLSSSSANTNMTISNNFVYNVRAGGFAGSNIEDNGYGIAVHQGGGYKIYYNSIDLSANATGTAPSGNAAAAITAAIWVNASPTFAISGLDIRNNIFSNQETLGTRFAFFSGQPNTVYTNINYNDYFSSQNIGSLGGVRATLANWQTATGQDANSVAVNPVFTSLTDLHVLLTSPLNALATNATGITDDIDNTARDGATPDIGADEFTPLNCTSNAAGTANATATTICPSTPITLSATGYALGQGIVYQWEYDNGGGWTTMAGQTNPLTANPGVLAVTTSFRLKVTCPTCCGGAPNTSIVVVVTVNNPQVSGTTPASRCGIGTVNLGATAAAGTLNWYTAPTGGTAVYTSASPSTFTTPTISATTTYYVSNTVAGCEGTRTAVIATVTTPPVFTSVTPVTPTTICGGANVNLNVTSGTAYTYVWNPGSLAGAAQTVNPTSTTTYTVTATTALCRRDSSIVINVTPTPTNLTVSPATASVCATGAVTTITATGGILVGQTVHTENFETFPTAQYAVAGSGVTAAQNITYYQSGTNSVLLTHGNNADGSYAMTSNINLTQYANPVLTFSQICALEVTAGTHFDFGFVQYSTDGGGSWTSFPTGAYGGTGILQNGVVSFDKGSYPDWDAQFTGAGVSPGAGPATSLWKNETINLSAYTSASTFRIRFRITSDGSLLFFGWLLDNIKITGDGQAPVTWAPQTNLWQNVGCSVPVLAGTNISTVYSNTGSTITYTATATGGPGCIKTATSTLNVSALAASVSITANPSGTICSGDCVTFTATTVNGGGAPGFKWTVNGIQVNLPLGFNPGQAVYTICGLQNGDVVQCSMFSNAGGCVSNPNPSNTIIISANPTPTVSINQSGALCFPSTLTLNTTGTITNYQWLLGGAPTGINASTHNATVPGTYSCIVTTNLGCKDTATDVVLSQQTYTITSTVSNGSISPLGATVVNCGANQVYTYTPNAGYSVCDVLIDGSSVGTPASPYTFTNVTGNHTIDVIFCVPGCPYVYTAVAGSTTFICAGQTYTLGGSISCTPANGGFGANWTTSGDGTFNGGGVFGTATTYTPGAGDIGGGIVFLTLTTNNPGGGSCVAATHSMQLRIRPLPTVNITGTLGVCSAGTTSTLLTANASLVSGTITGYQWYNITTSTNLGTASTQAVTSAGDYRVTVTGSNTCSNTATVTVVNFPSPTVSISPSSATVCTGATVNLTATPSGGSGSYAANAYAWYNPAAIGGATASVYAAAVSGSPYTVTVTDNNGCLSAASTGVTVSADVTPLNGPYTISSAPASCTNYVSFASAISDLNTRGISGNVRFDVAAGFVENLTATLSLGSATLNPTLAGRSISFQKSGAGANPLINAYAGTKTPTDLAPDGIWNLKGVDNVSISSINLTDGNAANPATMEYGFGLFKLSAADGAQNNTIQNCVITLNRVNDAAGTAIMPDGSTGIAVINATPTTATTAITPSGASGTNSSNKFYGNTIQNCQTGIALMGYAAATPFTLGDNANDVGGTSSGTGNNILNYGGAATLLSIPQGVRASNQWDIIIAYNTINNNNGSGVSASNTIRGIYGEAGTSANATISNNTITLNRISTASGMIAIENAIGSPAAGNTVLISNNVINSTFATATTGTQTNILNTAAAATVTITGNTVQNCTLTGSGNWVGISNTGNTTNTTISNNIVQTNALLTTASGAANFVGIGNSGTATTLIMNGNSITGNSKPINTSVVNWFQTSTVTNATVNSNTISNNTLNAAGATAAVTGVCFQGPTTAVTLLTFNANTINNNSITGMSAAFAATLMGYTTTTTNESITNNTIQNLFISGTSTGALHNIRGIYCLGLGGAVRTVTGNLVSNLYSSSGISTAINGIYGNLGATINIHKNRVHSLFPGQSAAAGAFAKGISVTAASVVANVSNNYVSIDLTQASGIAANSVLTGADAVRGIEVTAGLAVNVYYNTIRLAGNGSGAAFGSTAMDLTSTTPVVEMKNNLVTNFMVPGGTGIIVALRRTNTAMTGYNVNSNNNLWYTTETATTPLYYDGTAVYATLAAFKTQVSTRETASIDDLPVFTSTATNDLHLVVGSNCGADGGGQVIAGYTDDYDAPAVRDATFPDIGADEISGGSGSPTWRGRNTDWMNVNNWCGVIPTAATDVVIPNGVANYPVITTSAPVAKSITIANAASVTINAGGRLTVNSNFANSGILTNNGRIVLNGTSSQTFPGAAGTVAAMDTLEVNNNGAGVVLNKGFRITGALLPTLGTFDLGNFNDTLKSTATKTAMVGVVGTTNAFIYSGTGRFVVERYIATGTGGSLHGKTWQFMAVPTKGDFIKTSWMEGNLPTVNAVPGFGTIITSEKAGATARGYDFVTTPGPSMKTYNPVTNGWVSVDDGATNTSAKLMDNQNGYMLFVRGDRSVQTSAAAATPTTLRTKGKLYALGTEAPATINVTANKFESIGNPYAAAIDFTTIGRTGGVDNAFYVWDPTLSGAYGLGGYQAISSAGGWIPSSAGTTDYPAATVVQKIQSGQAFFVHATGSAGTVPFAEANKTTGSTMVFKPGPVADRAYLRAALYTGPNGNIADGNVVAFDHDFSNTVDGDDALKLMNGGENFGISRDGQTLSIEARRPIVTRDTIFYYLSNLRQQVYEFRFTPQNINVGPHIQGFLVDKYLKKRTVVSMNDNSVVPFTVNADKGSYASDRFMLVFKRAKKHGGHDGNDIFTDIDAKKQDNDILVTWNVNDEEDINLYEVEKSADGNNFSKLNVQEAKGNGSTAAQYNWIDANPVVGDNFYRVRIVDMGGDFSYSKVVKVNIEKAPSAITVYPNPVQEDRTINVNMTDKPAGNYILKITDSKGQQVMTKTINHAGGNNVYTIMMDKVRTHGNYMITITGDNNVNLTFKIVY